MNYCKIIAQDYSAAIRKCNNVSQSVCVCGGEGNDKKNQNPKQFWDSLSMKLSSHVKDKVLSYSGLRIRSWDLIPQQGFDWFYFSSFILFHNICIKSDTYEHLIIFGF